MKTPPSRRKSKEDQWPRKVDVIGGPPVRVYRRKRSDGSYGFEVANYIPDRSAKSIPDNSNIADNSDGKPKRRQWRKAKLGKRVIDSYPTEAEAMAAASALARKKNEGHTFAAKMTDAEAADYATSRQALTPFNITLAATASIVAECLKFVGGLTDLLAAAKHYGTRHKRTVAKRVSEVVEELLKLKEARHAAPRYLQDLRYRLNRFAKHFQRDACNVTTAEIQTWLDSEKLSPQGYTNFRRVLSLFFEFCVSRGYASDNPVDSIEKIKVKGSETAIFTPKEIARLLSVASEDFLPCIALGAFAGLRSAEIERLEWSDIQLAERHIVVGKDKSKTASRRVVPISDNLAAWLAPYSEKSGKVWTGGSRLSGKKLKSKRVNGTPEHDAYYVAQQETAAATEVKADPEKGIKAEKPVKWKANALRHSYASYRFAQIGDAGRVAGELGNSAAVVHKHYRELVKPADAVKWFAVAPETPANVTTMKAASE